MMAPVLRDTIQLDEKGGGENGVKNAVKGCLADTPLLYNKEEIWYLLSRVNSDLRRRRRNREQEWRLPRGL